MKIHRPLSVVRRHFHRSSASARRATAVAEAHDVADTTRSAGRRTGRLPRFGKQGYGGAALTFLVRFVANPSLSGRGGWETTLADAHPTEQRARQSGTRSSRLDRLSPDCLAPTGITLCYQRRTARIQFWHKEWTFLALPCLICTAVRPWSFWLQ
jgi:hypothetical protein